MSPGVLKQQQVKLGVYPDKISPKSPSNKAKHRHGMQHIIVGSLSHNIKCIEASIVICCYINETVLN